MNTWSSTTSISERESNRYLPTGYIIQDWAVNTWSATISISGEGTYRLYYPGLGSEYLECHHLHKWKRKQQVLTYRLYHPALGSEYLELHHLHKWKRKQQVLTYRAHQPGLGQTAWTLVSHSAMRKKISVPVQSSLYSAVHYSTEQWSCKAMGQNTLCFYRNDWNLWTLASEGSGSWHQCPDSSLLLQHSGLSSGWSFIRVLPPHSAFIRVLSY